MSDPAGSQQQANQEVKKIKGIFSTGELRDIMAAALERHIPARDLIRHAVLDDLVR